MKNRRILAVLLVLAGPTLITAQDTAGRSAAQAVVKQRMLDYFQNSGRPNIPPKGSWTPRDKGELSVLLDNELEKAKKHGKGLEVLAVLDCMEEDADIKPKDLNLKVEVAWTEGYYKDAVKASSKTPLAKLVSALDRERQGKVDPNEPSSEMLLRLNRFEIVGTYLTWPPFLNGLLRREIKKILESDAYVSRAELPDGFYKNWVSGAIGPTEKWDARWDSAWQANDFAMVCSLLKSIENYHPNGLSEAQKGALTKRQNTDWGLPYLWAKGTEENNPLGIFGESFVARIRAARIVLSGQTVEAEEALAEVAANPRDHYELSLLQDKMGTEAALNRLVAQNEFLLKDPHIPGWNMEQAQLRLSNAQARLGQIRSARAAEKEEAEKRAALAKQEAVRQAIAAKQEASRQAAARQAEAVKRAAIKAATPAQTPPSQPDSSEISARDLHAAYSQNEVAADENYRGKVLTITGSVTGINKDFSDNIFVTISTGEMFSELHAYFNDSQKSAVTHLRKGQRIKFKGKVSGMVMRSVIVKNCVF
jgi:hypothetical protein